MTEESMKDPYDDNPYITPENYYAGYQDSIDGLKNKPEIVEFDKLCHLVFNTPDGKKFMEEVEKRYLIPALSSPANPQYAMLVTYTEGFKEAFRMLKNCVMTHEQRIKAETQRA
jgi:hypothetical protein